MFYYYSIEDGKVLSVYRVKDVPIERFYQEKEKAERRNQAIKYEIVPEGMELLAEYALEVSKRAIDCEEIGAQIEEIREALIKIEWEIEGDE